MSTASLPDGVRPNLSLMDIINNATPGDARLTMCIQCGTCGGSCPSGPDMDHSPRQLFAMIRAEMLDDVLASNTPWFCVSCYFCTVRCPQQVQITDVMYTIKSMAIKAGRSEVRAGADFAETFVSYVEGYGRSFELGLATRQTLRHQPLHMLQAAGMGLGMLRKNRIDLTPTRIAGLAQLQAILARAKAIEEREPL